MKPVFIIWLVPRNFVIGFLKLYRKYVSPLYGDVCRYYPTCSSYGLQQIQQRGVVFGSVLTLIRIVRCNPWSQGGVDEVKPGSGFFRVTDRGYVFPKKGK